ncbi:alpha/beta fold hydrolase [Sinomonas atrocyanea]|uniref:alpha/beta fold hydrolase n=1 Tax=Sinomonas atrocyanea TaxID=37927 RepID=UPI0027835E20|nr:alpha/beta hydrolase [Sinomonas atrocyanea]MDQ0258354.1 pimeloyl-ACP methyl ester carboxylesterase [Sinomonas atrocyanea]MDR6620623.1 pimeloyl-ACP methyl ester carboxylesterase [Sinomonas atrocyanea]
MSETLDYRTFDVAVRGGALRAGEWSRRGREGGQTVLAVHGVTSSHLAWPFVASTLLAPPAEWPGGSADDAGGPGSAPGVARVVAPDLRGRGRSNALPGPYGMTQHADDLAAVLRAAGADADRPAVVVGHSMGAFASLVLADRHAELVERLVLVDGGIPLAPPPGMSPEEALQALLGPAAERLRMEFTSPEAYLDYWGPHPAFTGAWTPEFEDYIRYDLDGAAPRLRPATALAALADDNADLYGGESLLGALDRLRVPTLLLRAERGLLGQLPPLYPAEVMDRVRQEHPAIDVHDVPGTNHYTIVMTEDGASAVARAVLAGAPLAADASAPRDSDTPG